MKISKLTKILIVIVVLLSISITITASNLGYINKIISNKPPKVDKELVQNEVEPVEISTEDKAIQQVPEEPIAESPVIKDLVEEIPIVENPLTPEDKDTNVSISKDPSTTNTNTPIDRDNKLDKSKEIKQNNSATNKPVNNSSNNSNNANNKPDTSNNSNNNNGNDKKSNDKKNTKSIVASKNISMDEAIEIGLNKIGPKSKLTDLESQLEENPPK